MKRSPNNTNRKIARRDGEFSTEPGLPFQIVHYPGHYGAFFGFSEAYDSPIFLCSCSEISIENYVRHRLSGQKGRRNSDPAAAFILSRAHFPKILVTELMRADVEEDASIVGKIRFQDGLCHEFEQSYGWYINKQSYAFGVVPVSYKILPEVCQDEIFEACSLDKIDFIQRYMALPESDLVLAVARNEDFGKQARKIRNVIENEVRAKFGFNRVGDAWASETLLYQLVSETFPDEKIIRHYRPAFLERLELDIFIPEKRIGVEYQGIQHFRAIDHWGGVEALEKIRARDLRKKDLCLANDINLIYFYHTDSLSIDFVRVKVMLAVSNSQRGKRY